jgi:hypothetical protein
VRPWTWPRSAAGVSRPKRTAGSSAVFTCSVHASLWRRTSTLRPRSY